MRGTVFGTSSFLVNWSLSNFSNLCFSGRIRLTNGFLLINVVYMKGCMILSQNFVISRYSLKKCFKCFCFTVIINTKKTEKEQY